AERVRGRRHHVVVYAAPVVPGQEDRAGLPVAAAHDGVDDPGHERLAGAHLRGRVLAVLDVGHDPRHLRQGAGLGRRQETGQRLDVAGLVVLVHVAEPRQDAPGLRDAVAVAAALAAVVEIVAPAHLVLVQQPGEVGPRVRSRVVRGWALRRGAALAAH